MTRMNGSKVLYISNIEVPYRTKFFNLLGKECDLTVLYERKRSDNRDAAWAKSEHSTYNKEYLNGIKYDNERALSLSIFKYIFGKYDKIIIGCFNSPVQMLAILAMKIAHRKYYVNVDGKTFDTGNAIKRALRRFFIRGARGYFCAGIKASEYLRDFVGENKPIYTYLFSSMDEAELSEAGIRKPHDRSEKILVVGQYEDYKGLDIAAQVAKQTPNYEYLFVGMGNKEKAFRDYLAANEIRNAEVIPFLQKEDLRQLYLSLGALILPSRQECWGLVINEAAAYGMPIVSTWGSGAAEEFLSPQYDRYLAEPEDVESLRRCIEELMNSIDEEKEQYSIYLFNKSKDYFIEENVNSFLTGLEE